MAKARRLLLTFVCAALLVAGTNGCGGGGQASRPHAWPKVSHLRDGSTVSVWQSGRVVQRDHRGRLVAESFCGSYARYQRWVKVMSAFRAAVGNGDSRRIATLVHYPVRWNHGRPSRSTMIVNREQLLGLYDSIFRPGVVAEIMRAEPQALFCRNVSEAMIGSGVLWGDEWNGRRAIFAVNGAAR